MVTATTESTLGRLWTVGAMAVDVFVGELKSALSHLVPADVSSVCLPGEDVPIVVSSSTAAGLVGSDFQRNVTVSSRQGSVVPSACGEVA